MREYLQQTQISRRRRRWKRAQKESEKAEGCVLDFQINIINNLNVYILFRHFDGINKKTKDIKTNKPT